MRLSGRLTPHYVQVDDILSRNVFKQPNGTTKHSASRDRIAAEKTQVYERLTHLDPKHLVVYFERFNIPMKEKKKKAALTECLCKSSVKHTLFCPKKKSHFFVRWK